MGGATRIMTLLTTPFPPLCPSLLLLRRRLPTLSPLPLRPLNLFSPRTNFRNSQLVRCFHSQPNNNSYFAHSSSTTQSHQHQHPWMEWTHFLNILSNGQGQGVSSPEEPKILPEDSFVVYEQLPDDFVRASASCLAFARARPNLLGSLPRKDIETVVSNGTPFLFKSALDVARRMRAFLGTDGSNVSELDGATTADLMKYILSYASNPTVSPERGGLYSRELVDSSVRNLLHELVTVSTGALVGYMPPSTQQSSSRSGQLPRPIGQNVEMKRGDWICPKCNFMNFAKNMKCLECEGPRPRKQLTGGEWECPQCNFFNYGKNLVCLRCDCKRPGAPLFNAMNSGSGWYNGEYSNRSNMDSGRLAGNEERAQHWFSKFSEMNAATDLKNAPPNKGFHESIPSLREGENTIGFGETKSPSDKRLSNSQHQINPSYDSNGSNSIPDAINQSSGRDSVGTGSSSLLSQSGFSESQYSTDVGNQNMPSNVRQNIGGDLQFHNDYRNDKSALNEEKGQVEKSETWFKRVTELHGINDRPSAVSDEDFPEIMPMRKGENRFVVSKKKDRSLTTPNYKRQVAMDQANPSNFVPFVPFPPGYFAQKNTEQSSTSNSNAPATNEVKSTSSVSSKFPLNNTTAGPRIDNQPTSSGNSQLFGPNVPPPAGKENVSQSGTVGPTNMRDSWTGKSLEGSAVKEPDPLDMSEEAKAERWFKRVAQIKDISELSQIPDEDFPSIMPMRKGVNRFVVSKRKTPLERRLTSQQYRRNLPIVSNDNVKKENDNSS